MGSGKIAALGFRMNEVQSAIREERNVNPSTQPPARQIDD